MKFYRSIKSKWILLSYVFLQNEREVRRAFVRRWICFLLVIGIFSGFILHYWILRLVFLEKSSMINVCVNDREWNSSIPVGLVPNAKSLARFETPKSETHYWYKNEGLHEIFHSPEATLVFCPFSD